MRTHILAVIGCTNFLICCTCRDAFVEIEVCNDSLTPLDGTRSFYLKGIQWENRRMELGNFYVGNYDIWCWPVSDYCPILTLHLIVLISIDSIYLEHILNIRNKLCTNSIYTCIDMRIYQPMILLHIFPAVVDVTFLKEIKTWGGILVYIYTINTYLSSPFYSSLLQIYDWAMLVKFGCTSNIPKSSCRPAWITE